MSFLGKHSGFLLWHRVYKSYLEKTSPKLTMIILTQFSRRVHYSLTIIPTILTASSHVDGGSRCTQSTTLLPRAHSVFSGSEYFSADPNICNSYSTAPSIYLQPRAFRLLPRYQLFLFSNDRPMRVSSFFLKRSTAIIVAIIVAIMKAGISEGAENSGTAALCISILTTE